MNLDNKNESVAVWVICIYTYSLLDTCVCVCVRARACACKILHICLFVKIMFVSPVQFPRTLLLPSRQYEACSLHSNFLETVCVCVCFVRHSWQLHILTTCKYGWSLYNILLQKANSLLHMGDISELGIFEVLKNKTFPT